MNVITSDGKRSISVGTSDTLLSLYSTIHVRLNSFQEKIPLAMDFLRTGSCSGENGLVTARQFNMLRDELSKFPPEKAVYDFRDLKKDAPWKNNISSVVTSCANLYTTADGKDLLYEIVSILCYAEAYKVSVSIA